MSNANIELRHQIQGNSVRLFLIQTPTYGKKLSVFNNLFNKAKQYFPDLKEEDVDLGIVKNTGYMDHHALITFTLEDREKLPEDFKKLTWFDYFVWLIE